MTNINDRSHEPDRFAIIPIYSDSTGSAAIPQNAVAHGSWSAITGRIRDSKQQRQMLSLINDADKVRRAQAELKADTAAFEADKAAFADDVDSVREVLLNEFVGRLDKLAARLDALEQERAKDPDPNEQPSPPGYPDDAPDSTDDDGELQSEKDRPDPNMPRSPVTVED